MNDSIVLKSEHVKKVHPENTECTLIGKSHVIHYWSQLTDIVSVKYDKFELVKIGSHAEAICYFKDSEEYSRLNIQLDEYGKINLLEVSDSTNILDVRENS